MKEIFIEYWKEKRLLGLYSIEDISNWNNYEISDSNIKSEVCEIQLFNDILTKINKLR